MKKHKNRNPETQLDNYLDDLVHKRPTTRPADVDDDAALVIGSLMHDAEMDSPDEAVKEQLWNQILFMIHCQPDQPLPMADQITSGTVDPLARTEQQSDLVMVPQAQRYTWLQKVLSSRLPDGFQLDVRALVGIYQHVAVMVAALGIVLVFSSLLLEPFGTIRTQPSDTLAFTTAAYYAEPEANVFEGIVKPPRYFPALLDTTGIYPSTVPIGYPVSIKPRASSNNVHLPWMLNMFTIPQ